MTGMEDKGKVNRSGDLSIDNLSNWESLGTGATGWSDMDERKVIKDIILDYLMKNEELSGELEALLESPREPLLGKPALFLWLEHINDELGVHRQVNEFIKLDHDGNLSEEHKASLSAILPRVNNGRIASYVRGLIGESEEVRSPADTIKTMPTDPAEERDWDEIFRVESKMELDGNFCEKLKYGQPREGHAEGTIQAHIDELSSNLLEVVKFLCSENKAAPGIRRRDLEVLKILILSHDSFKQEALPGVAITDPRSHASLARNYVSQHTSDKDILEMIQRHDEPYAIYKKFKETGKLPTDRLKNLIDSIQDWDTFLIFQTIDNVTSSKILKSDSDHVSWFLDITAELRTPKLDQIRIYKHLRDSLIKVP